MISAGHVWMRADFYRGPLVSSINVEARLPGVAVLAGHPGAHGLYYLQGLLAEGVPA